MGHSAMAVPAISGSGIDRRNELGMTPDAVLLGDCFSVRRELRIISERSREKKRDVLHAVDTLPQEVIGEVVVWKVAVHAFFRPVRARMRPRLKMLFMKMAFRAKFRRFREKYHMRRPDQSVDCCEPESGSEQREQNDVLPVNYK
jgi:hypothetical protein